jgi:hypothetical protein
MPIDPLEVGALGIVLAFMAFFYFWLRRSQRSQKSTREQKVRCRDLILSNRHALASAGVEIEGLVNLVRLKITCAQLDAVIRLLVKPRIRYDADNPGDSENMEVDLDFDKPGEVVENPETKEAATESKKEPAVEESPAPQAVMADRMDQAEESTWLKLAHQRFMEAMNKRGLTEQRPKLRLLVKMVELGKKATDGDLQKTPARKEYERGLWDRFYENEYLDLNSGQRQK